MKLLGLAVLAVGLMAAGISGTSVAAAADKAPGSGPSPYRDCGIGAALFPDTNWAAVTSNVIWDLGITALTSATASPGTCNGSKMKAAMFIGTSYDRLAEQTAAGKGEHLVTALTLFGCTAKQQPAAIMEVRAAMGKAVSAPGYMGQSKLEKSAAYYESMELAATHSCSA